MLQKYINVNNNHKQALKTSEVKNNYQNLVTTLI